MEVFELLLKVPCKDLQHQYLCSHCASKFLQALSIFSLDVAVDAIQEYKYGMIYLQMLPPDGHFGSLVATNSSRLDLNTIPVNV